MNTIKRWMVWVGTWLVRMGSWPPDPTPADALRDLAVILTKRQDEHWPERDGECKRAAVYAQLTNTFPDRNKREVSVAIEEALCGDS